MVAPRIHDGLTARERREALATLVREGRVHSQMEAARLLGVSHTRVYQLLKELGLRLNNQGKPKPVLRICVRCGSQFRKHGDPPDLCRRCAGRRVTVTCPDCGAERPMYPSAVAN